MLQAGRSQDKSELAGEIKYSHESPAACSDEQSKDDFGSSDLEDLTGGLSNRRHARYVMAHLSGLSLLHPEPHLYLRLHRDLPQTDRRSHYGPVVTYWMQSAWSLKALPSVRLTCCQKLFWQ
jgi:hypothetical protein